MIVIYFTTKTSLFSTASSTHKACSTNKLLMSHIQPGNSWQDAAALPVQSMAGTPHATAHQGMQGGTAHYNWQIIMTFTACYNRSFYNVQVKLCAICQQMDKGSLRDSLPELLGYCWLQKDNSLMDFSKLMARQAQEVSRPTTKT